MRLALFRPPSMALARTMSAPRRPNIVLKAGSLEPTRFFGVSPSQRRLCGITSRRFNLAEIDGRCTYIVGQCPLSSDSALVFRLVSTFPPPALTSRFWKSGTRLQLRIRGTLTVPRITDVEVLTNRRQAAALPRYWSVYNPGRRQHCLGLLGEIASLFQV